MKFEEKAKGKT